MASRACRAGPGAHGTYHWGEPPRCRFCGRKVAVNGEQPPATPPWGWPGELLGRYKARQARTMRLSRMLALSRLEEAIGRVEDRDDQGL
jgi:hypothetical protein